MIIDIPADKENNIWQTISELFSHHRNDAEYLLANLTNIYDIGVERIHRK